MGDAQKLTQQSFFFFFFANGLEMFLLLITETESLTGSEEGGNLLLLRWLLTAAIWSLASFALSLRVCVCVCGVKSHHFLHTKKMFSQVHLTADADVYWFWRGY